MEDRKDYFDTDIHREEEKRCEVCNSFLMLGYEEYEFWGFEEGRVILYCPNCN